MATAAAPEAPAKPYAKLLSWLSSQDANAFYIAEGPTRKDAPQAANVPTAVLPKEFADARALSAAWVDGLVEFGRCNHSFGYHAHPDGKGSIALTETGTKQTFAWLDEGCQWTGHRKTTHLPLRDILAEDVVLPSEVVKQAKTFNENRKEYEITKKKLPGQLLRLQCRLTDKGWGALAGNE